MRDPFRTVFFHHVFDYLFTAHIIEIHVDIGQGDTGGIEETLKQQVVFNRVDIGDAQAIGKRRTRRRTTPGAYENAHFTRGTDKVPHNKEVARKTHPLNRGKLKVDALAQSLVFPEILPVAFLGALVGEVAQVIHVGSKGLGQGEMRHQGGVFQLKGLYLLHDFARVFQVFGMFGKQGRHFIGALEVFLPRIEQFGFLVELLARIEAYQDFVRLVVVGVHKMHVVGGDALDVVFGGKLFQTGVHNLLLFVPVPLHFEIVILSEKRLMETDVLFQQFFLPRKDGLRHFARQTGRTADKAFVVFLQQFVVDTRLVVKGFLALAQRTEFNQIVVTHGVFGQQDKVVAAPFFPPRFLQTALRRYIHLAAHNGLDSRFLGLGDELHDPVHITVVGNGNGIHAIFLGAFHQGGNLAGPVEYRIKRVQVKVGKIWHSVFF